jgi:hypothetical protein
MSQKRRKVIETSKVPWINLRPKKKNLKIIDS